jgi:hypothetical protein
MHGERVARSERERLATRCPHGRPGDRLWVRETHARVGCKVKCEHLGCHTIFRANELSSIGAYAAVKWTPAMHMFRWASRLLLEVAAVRVERVQDISAADARAEGFEVRPEVSADPEVHDDAARDWYAELWDKMRAGTKYAWACNPWVWVVEFRRVE